METVQVSINDAPYASALRDMLGRNCTLEVRFAEVPDTKERGVIVIDSDALDRLPLPLLNPERVVLITKNDPLHLAQAWNAGIRSVVFNEDPLSTAVLAILAAELRVPKTESRWNLQGARGGPSHGTARRGGTAPLSAIEANAQAPKPRERRG